MERGRFSGPLGSLRTAEGGKSGVSETSTIHNALRAHLWNRNSCHMRLLRCTAEQSCSVYEAQAPKQSEMAQVLALCWDSDEGMVSGLSARDGHRRLRLRTGMAHAAHSAFFKVAHYQNVKPLCPPCPLWLKSALHDRHRPILRQD